MSRCIYRGPRGGISGPKRGGVGLPFSVFKTSWNVLALFVAAPPIHFCIVASTSDIVPYLFALILLLNNVIHYLFCIFIYDL